MIPRMSSIQGSCILCILFFLGCGLKRPSSTNSHTRNTLIQAKDTSDYTRLYVELLQDADNDYIINCSPDTLFAGDTIVITMNVPHGGEILITRPDSVSIVLDSYTFSKSETDRLRKRYNFALDDKLCLPASYETDYEFLRGKKTVFDVEGLYRIGIYKFTESEVLAKDECEIWFVGRIRHNKQ